MKFAMAVMLLVFIAGCTGTQDIYQPRPAAQTPVQTSPSQATPTAISQDEIRISLGEVPATMRANGKAVIKWKVDSNQEKDITHTAVHYSNKSVVGIFTTDVTPERAGYAELTGISTDAKIPNEFSLPIFSKGAGIIYLRAHVLVDGKNYWTEERSIAVE